MANLGEMFVRIGVDTSDLNSGLSKASKSVRSFGMDLKRIGSGLTRTVTLPLTAIGTAALVVASQSDQLKGSFAALSTRVQDIARGFASALSPAISVLIKIANKFLDVISNLISWFDSLSTPIKTVIVGFAALLAILGPVLVVIGILATAFAAIVPIIFSTIAALGGFIPALAILIPTVGWLGAAFYKLGKSSDKMSLSFRDQDKEAMKVLETLKKLSKANSEAMTNTVAAGMQFEITGDDLEFLSSKLKIAEADFKTFTEAAAQLQLQGRENLAGQQLINAADAKQQIDVLTGAIDRLKSVGDVTQIFEGLRDAQAGLAAAAIVQGPIEALTEVVNSYAAAIQNLSVQYGFNSQQVQALIPVYESYYMMLQQGQVIADAWKSIQESVGVGLDTFTNSLAQTIAFGKSFAGVMKQIFRDMVADIIASILKAIVKLVAFRIVLSFFPGMTLPGGGGFGNLLGGLLGIKGMAEGGIITQPTLALVGESGPEAVIPLNQLQGFGQQTINIDLDGRRLAESTVRNMPSVLRVQTGIMQ